MTRSQLAGSGTTVPLEQIITCCKEGDVNAFRQLVDLHQGYAFTLAFRILCDEENAKDVVQESFIRVWKHIAEYDPRVKFTTWLYKIVIHLAYDVLKHNVVRKKIFVSPTDSRETGTDDLSGEIANRDLAAQIKEMVDGLPPKQRMVFVMRDIQDMDVDEVADISGMSRAAVKTNLCYARQHIRKTLAARMK